MHALALGGPHVNNFLFVLSSEKLEIWIYVITNCLLQRHDTYTLLVQGVDMNGASSGNTGTGTVQINILDINDNVPTLEKEEVRSYNILACKL